MKLQEITAAIFFKKTSATVTENIEIYKMHVYST